MVLLTIFFSEVLAARIGRQVHTRVIIPATAQYWQPIFGKFLAMLGQCWAVSNFELGNIFAMGKNLVGFTNNRCATILFCFVFETIVYNVPRRIMRVITRRATMLAGDRSQGVIAA